VLVLVLVLVLGPRRHEHPPAFDAIAAASTPASTAGTTGAAHNSPFTAPLIASIAQLAAQTPGSSPHALIAAISPNPITRSHVAPPSRDRATANPSATLSVAA
jgi:hypothetical protein